MGYRHVLYSFLPLVLLSQQEESWSYLSGSQVSYKPLWHLTFHRVNLKSQGRKLLNQFHLTSNYQIIRLFRTGRCSNLITETYFRDICYSFGGIFGPKWRLGIREKHPLKLHCHLLENSCAYKM